MLVLASWIIILFCEGVVLPHFYFLRALFCLIRVRVRVRTGAAFRYAPWVRVSVRVSILVSFLNIELFNL